MAYIMSTGLLLVADTKPDETCSWKKKSAAIAMPDELDCDFFLIVIGTAH
jgi:hypothetical protein